MIPVNEPLLNGNEKKYLMECIDTGWISSEGPFIQKFENNFSKMVNRKHGIAVANGSAALDIAIAALELKEGDEVILPTFTIICCANAIVRAKAIPVVVDSNPITWNMDISQIEKKITKKTKAIMVVHIYGLPVDMDPILSICQKYNLKLIEDAAEMHGQTYKGKPCGSFGDISIFSFYPNKHITTGEGGMIVTNCDRLALRCKSLRNLCFKPEQRFIHDEIGWNYRMTNVQAALGVAQLERIEEFVHKKREMGKFYLDLLSNIKDIQLPLVKTEYAENIFWVFAIIISTNNNLTAKDVMQKLADKKIGTRPFFWCMHEQPVYQKMGLFHGESYPVAENMARKGFYIPSGLAVTKEQMVIVANALKEIFA